jgi:putative DNA methylase
MDSENKMTIVNASSEENNHQPRRYVRRLIEVDLPIKRISDHARREKSIRHGHISTLHIWWARRPLAACRSVICAALWPDPADPYCPQAFRDKAVELLTNFAVKAVSNSELARNCTPETWTKWQKLANPESRLDSKKESHLNILRYALLDFIADFANWDNSTNEFYLETSRALTEASHISLGGEPGTRPLVVDPFAGGGAIPLESLRVGADAFASDLNPVAVLLNKVVLEYVPKYGSTLVDDVRCWGEWVKREAEKELAEFYPKDPDGATPVAYLWARTIICEGPSCGAELPLIRSRYLSKKGQNSIFLEYDLDNGAKKIGFKVGSGYLKGDDGTVKRGAATCPICGYTTSVASVRRQLKESSGGADNSKLLVVVRRGENGKTYRVPSSRDLSLATSAVQVVQRGPLLQNAELPLMSGVFNVPIYGMTRWDLLFSSRQLLAASTILQKIEAASQQIALEVVDKERVVAIKVLLSLALGKYLDFRSTLCGWINVGEKIGHTFGRQALGMIFDWTEGVPFGDISGSWERSIGYIAEFIETEAKACSHKGSVEQSPAQHHPLADDSVQAFITDPPYYNAVPYADLSDFFYLWLRKGLIQEFPSLFEKETSPKDDELCEMSGWDSTRYPHKDASFYEQGMKAAFAEGRRICSPSGIGTVVFAHKSTTGWETLLSALVDSGWIITGSWPIDTERSGRLRAMGSAALASSVHLVCRPRENDDGSLLADSIGDYRDVLHELPQRIREWLPRLAAEGVVGADAIFACLGPALEIFSRYSRVEKVSGETVTLREYLEHVWAAVSKEALNMVFAGADATGFEADSRLTAIWLWTLGTSSPNGDQADVLLNGQEDAEEEEQTSKGSKTGLGYMLEFDAARKIAQGLGAHLEDLNTVVEIKGDKALLLPVTERSRFLFGKSEDGSPQQSRQGRKKKSQLEMFEGLRGDEGNGGFGDNLMLKAGATTLDRVHQSMLLFAAGRGEALKRFLVEDGVGRDQRFWRLADALSKLYPMSSDEKRWVDGVLARKKGLGF